MPETAYPCGLVLLGHGSSDDPRAADTVFEAARRLRSRFVDVRVGLLAAEPSVADALAEVRGDPVVVVPFFMADGWITRTRLPRSLEAAAPDGRCRILVDAAGSSPALAAGVVASLGGVAGDGPPPSVLVVGHGTPRDSRSGDTVEKLVRALTAAQRFTAVVSAFIESAPSLDERWAELREDSHGGEVIVLPFFAGVGPHVRVDVPVALGLPDEFAFGERYVVDGVGVRYLPPVGASTYMDDAIVARVRGALRA